MLKHLAAPLVFYCLIYQGASGSTLPSNLPTNDIFFLIQLSLVFSALVASRVSYVVAEKLECFTSRENQLQFFNEPSILLVLMGILLGKLAQGRFYIDLATQSLFGGMLFGIISAFLVYYSQFFLSEIRR